MGDFVLWGSLLSGQMLTNNRIWKNRTVDIGVVTAEEALNYGFRYSLVCVYVCVYTSISAFL